MVDGWGVACARGGQPEAGGGLLDDGSRTRKILIVIPVLRIKLDLAAQAKERLTGLTPLRHFGDLRISEALVVFGNLFGKLPARTQVVVRLEGLLFGHVLGWVDEFVAVLRHLRAGSAGRLGTGYAQVVVLLDGRTLRVVGIHTEAVPVFRHRHELTLNLDAAHLGNGVRLLGELLHELATVFGGLWHLALLFVIHSLGTHLQMASLLLLGSHIAAKLIRRQLTSGLVPGRQLRLVEEHLAWQYLGAGIQHEVRGVLHAIGGTAARAQLQVLRIADGKGAGAVGRNQFSID